MRRIYLALTLSGVVAATGCGTSGSDAGNSGNPGIAEGTYTVSVQNGQAIGGAVANPVLAMKNGHVTSVPAGIDCGATFGAVAHTACSFAFPTGSTVVLTAAGDDADGAGPLAAKALLTWGGDCLGDAATCSLDGAADKYVVAVFGDPGSVPHPNYSDPAIHAAAFNAAVLDCASCHGASATGQGIAVSCALCHKYPGGATVPTTGLKAVVQSVSTTTPVTVAFTLKTDAGASIDVTGADGKNRPMGVSLGLYFFGTDAAGNVLPYRTAANAANVGSPTSALPTITANLINPTTASTLPSATSFQYAAGTLTGTVAGVANTVCTVAAPCSCSAATPCTYSGAAGTQTDFTAGTVKACTVASPCVCTATAPCVPTLPTTNAAGMLTYAAGVYTYTFPSTVVYPAGALQTTLPNATLWLQASRQENLKNPPLSDLFRALDVEYNFRPFDTNPVVARHIVTEDTCNKCHKGFRVDELNAAATGFTAFHSGGRNSGPFCAACHYDGRKGTDPAPVDSKNFAHRIHGAEQVEIPAGSTSLFHGIAVTYPQDVRNCQECHADSAQGRQYKTRPSVLACTGCHYTLAYTSTGTTAAPAYQFSATATLPQTAHTGGSVADGTCTACHPAADIDAHHVAVWPPSADNAYRNVPLTTGTAGSGFTQGTGAALVYCTDAAADTGINGPCTCTVALPCTPQVMNANTNAAWIVAANKGPATATKVDWVMGSVSRDVNKHPVMTFKVQLNGVDTAINAGGANSTTYQILNGFVGAPSVYWAWAAPQDGIAAPADFNASTSLYIRTLFNVVDATKYSLSGPDAGGFYTVTINNVVVSDASKMLTGGVGYSYSLSSTQPLTQVDLAEYPYNATAAVATIGGVVLAPKEGGIVVPDGNVTMVAAGYTGRRLIVTNDRCNACHAQLGVKPTFHAGQRNDAPTCAWCHNPNRTSSAWSANAKDFIHGIHGTNKRSLPFNWHSACPSGYRFDAVLLTCVDVDAPTVAIPIATIASPWYDNVENPSGRCLDCHEPGMYDLSSAASQAALPNLLDSTVASGKYTAASISQSPYVAINATTDYGAGYAYAAATGVVTEAAATTLVKSPIVSACTGCHDTTAAIAHMELNGGVFYKTRTVAATKTEACLDCHGAGKIWAITEIHK